MISEDFEKLLELYEKGRLTAAQKAQLDKMLDELHTNKDHGELDLDKGWADLDARTTPTKPIRSWRWLAVAAAVALVSISALFVLFWNNNAVQQSNKIILPDGTLVWLKDGASLDYRDSFSEENRKVSLIGEALFEVVRDPAHPFVIHCGKYVASVLGTSFSIKATDSAVELTVLTGKVRIASTATAQSIIVNSREHVIFSESKGLVSKADSKTEEIRQAVANTQYDMHFEDTRMSEIVKRVEGKFDVTIELSNDDLLNCMISADFTDQSLPTTLTMISEALGVEFSIGEKKVTIRGAGCPE